jgi:hypothetical protein
LLADEGMSLRKGVLLATKVMFQQLTLLPTEAAGGDEVDVLLGVSDVVGAEGEGGVAEGGDGKLGASWGDVTGKANQRNKYEYVSIYK